jgi:hypothetical protein
MGNFYTDILQRDPRYRSTTPIRDPALLEPVTRAAVAAIIADAKAEGVELMILETYRSRELQHLYFQRGVTELQQVGVHHFGLACDLGVVVDGAVNWRADYSILGRLGAKHDVVWGGDWADPKDPHSFRDYDHVQRVAVVDQPKLFDGSWYPDDTYVAPAVG